MITKFNKYNNIDYIKRWLDDYNVKNYTINNDLTVDVDDYVDLSNKNLTEIPIQFNKVNGNFFIFRNRLTSLKGCPKEVDGSFYCSDNKLTSLEYCPIILKNSFFCDNNHLTSLKYCPKEIKDFNCRYNKLTSLEYGPIIAHGCYDCSNNELTTLKGSPKEVKKYFDCHKNPLVDITDLDSKILIDNIDDIAFLYKESWDKYFDKWIDKDINIFNTLKNKVSSKIKTKYSYLFNANNFDLI